MSVEKDWRENGGLLGGEGAMLGRSGLLKICSSTVSSLFEQGKALLGTGLYSLQKTT